MDIEFLLNSKEYKEMKKQYEKKYFKLFGKYCQYTTEKVNERSASEMAEFFKNKKVSAELIMEETTKKGDKITKTKTLSKSFYEVWSNDPNMLEYEEITFDCDVKKVPKTSYNLFKGFQLLERKEVDLKPIFEHLKSLVDYNEFNFNCMLNWLAHIVQQPEKLPDTSLIFISDEGVGKDLFYQLVAGAIGNHYCGNTDKLENIVGNFNGAIAGKLFFACNETNPIESAQRIENIKALITAKELYIEEKYKNAVKCKNFCRIVFFSNNLFAFPCDDGSRRPVIFRCSDKYLPVNFGAEQSQKYFKNLADNYINNIDYQQAFLKFLQQRDISQWNPKEFEKSKLHRTLIETSIKPIVKFLAQIVIENEDKEILKVITSESLADFSLFLKHQGYRFDYTPKKYRAELQMYYNVDVKKSGVEYYIFNIKELKKLLTTKYKYNFGEKQEEEEEPEPIVNKPVSPLDAGVVDDSKDKRIKELEEQLAELKKQLNLQQNANKPIKVKKMEEPVDDDLEKELESILSDTNKKSTDENITNITTEDEEDIANFILSSSKDLLKKKKNNKSTKKV